MTLLYDHYKPLIRVTREILEWASSGRSGWVPQDALQALDVVLKQVLNCHMAQMSVWHKALEKPVAVERICLDELALDLKQLLESRSK